MQAKIPVPGADYVPARIIPQIQVIVYYGLKRRNFPARQQ